MFVLIKYLKYYIFFNLYMFKYCFYNIYNLNYLII